MGDWTTNASRTAYENPWIRVREHDVVRPDGEPGVYGVVEMRHPSVFVVALTDADEVVLIELYRYTTGVNSLEVPAGGSDGEDPLVAAQRELVEEAGLEADEWQQIGRMDVLNGVANAPEYVFLARGLREVPGIDQEAEGITAVRRVPFEEALGLVRDGTIRDGETVACLMYAALALGRL